MFFADLPRQALAEFRKELFGVPPSGRHVWWTGMPIFTFEGTKVRDLFVLGDIHGLSRRSRNQKGVRRLSKNHPRLSGQCWMIRRFTSAQIVPATRVQG